MAEYIEREAVYEDFEKCNSENPKWTPSRVKTLIARQKAADVAPVRHAKVIDKIYDDHETIEHPWDYRYYCSACKIPMRDSWNKYCPNCGAKMDLEG